jgi:hypothetical protein
MVIGNAAIDFESENIDMLTLSKGAQIVVMTANYFSIHGYIVVAALLDETAFWRSDESANPDFEILAAPRPAMATMPDANLIAASSPRHAEFDHRVLHVR